MIVWQIIRRLATTAQNTPAGWLGTELPLVKIRSVREKENNRIKIHLLNVVAFKDSRVTRIGVESIYCLDVGDHDQNSA